MDPLSVVQELARELEEIQNAGPYRQPDAVSYRLWAERAGELLEEIRPGLAATVVSQRSWIMGRDTLDLTMRSRSALAAIAREIRAHPDRFSRESARRERERRDRAERASAREIAAQERAKRRHELLVAAAPNGVKYGLGGLLVLLGLAIGRCIPTERPADSLNQPTAASAPATIPAR